MTTLPGPHAMTAQAGAVAARGPGGWLVVWFCIIAFAIGYAGGTTDAENKYADELTQLIKERSNG